MTRPASPWHRSDWTALADRMLAAVAPYRSDSGARITLPGPTGGYGTDIDGLEGFARTFLLAGFRLAGERGADPADLAQTYARGLVAGTDPHGADRWVRMSEHGQAKVESASIALMLDMTRPWIWDRLSAIEQEQVVDYLAECVGDTGYPRSNWVWFRLVVQTFLRSVGGPHSVQDMTDDLATHDSFVREHGWISDGHPRNYDHYGGWALHAYPTLWAQMAGAGDLAAPRAQADRERLARVLTDLIHLVGADGSPLIQGRSLIYRFAAAAPFWVGALAGVDTVALGQLRQAAGAVVGHFTARGAPDARGLLTMGWHQEWPRLAQTYSGPGSPYWAAKGLLGIALPADHPVWSAAPVPLPAQDEADDDGVGVRAMPVPGWVLSRADGVVRVANHGTDHDVPGSQRTDSPLYARLGYSTATAPLLDAGSWVGPVDQAVVLTDADDRRTHRAGMTLRQARVDDTGAATGASSGPVRWVEVEPPQGDHGGGLPGVSQDAGTMTIVSVLRGGWEVRMFRITDPHPAATRWQAGGWALAGATPPREVAHQQTAAEQHGAAGQHRATSAQITDGRLHSALVALTGPPPRAHVSRHADASPLGEYAAVPVLSGTVEPGRWYAVGLYLGSAPTSAPHLDLGLQRAVITWPDGQCSPADLPQEA